MSTTLGNGPASGDDRDAADRDFMRIAWGILALIVIAMVAVSLAWESGDGADARAQELAADLVASLDEAGLQAPDEDVAARVYGTTGGIGCKVTDANALRSLNALNLKGTGEVTSRSSFIDPRFVQFERIVLETYCPDRVDEFDDFVDGLRLRNTLDKVR